MYNKKIVSLEGVANKFDEICEDWSIYYSLKTGEFVSVQEEHLGIAEDMESDEELENYRDWEKDAIKDAIDICFSYGDYVRLPSQYDIHEYSIMEDFAEDTKDEHKQELLFVALQGKGAFRRFKDTLIRTNLTEAWYAYKFMAFLKIAKEWCEDNKIEYTVEDVHKIIL